MKAKILFSTVLFAGAAALASAQESEKVSVTNPTRDAWKEAPVVVRWSDGMPGKGEKSLVARDGDQKRFVQVDDLDGDGTPDELVFLAELDAGETKEFTIETGETDAETTDRTHVGMYLKTDEKPGMEGPGWESDLVAFRIYWDERNATDVFGKTRSILSLEAFASPEVNYHNETKWGLDVLKVGPALGVGGFGIYENGKVEKVADAKREFKIVTNGPLRAAFDMIYTDWQTSGGKYNLTARMHIFAGQKWAETELDLEPLEGSNQPEFVTGVVKHEGTELIQDKSAGILGRWGKQALGDKEVPKAANLGLGVTADSDRIVAFGEDKVNSFVRLKNEDGKTRYRYHASWEKEPDAAGSAAEYREMLAKVARLKPRVQVKSKSE